MSWMNGGKVLQKRNHGRRKIESQLSSLKKSSQNEFSSIARGGLLGYRQEIAEPACVLLPPYYCKVVPIILKFIPVETGSMPIVPLRV